MYASLEGSGRYGTLVLYAIVLHIHVVLKMKVLSATYILML